MTLVALEATAIQELQADFGLHLRLESHSEHGLPDCYDLGRTSDAFRAGLCI